MRTPNTRGLILAALAYILATPSLVSQAETVLEAVAVDPAQDKANPPNLVPLALPTHGVKINGMLFTAAGPGRHPTVILFHGFPGNEQNLDLARAIQRAGWNVLTLHYRGSWGSPGRYTFAHCLEDGLSALEWLRASSTAARYPVDPDRIVVAGHSLGAFVAAWLAGHDTHLQGAALISASRFFGGLPRGTSRAEVVEKMETNLLIREGMSTLAGTAAEDLADEILHNNPQWDLAQFAANIAKHPLLIVTSNDGNAPYDDGIGAAAKAHNSASVKVVHLETDHSYNDARIALASAVVRWLQALPSEGRTPAP